MTCQTIRSSCQWCRSTLALAILALGRPTRYHRGDTSLGESVDQRICVVCLVAKQGLRVDAFEQGLRTSQVMSLSRRQHQFDGIAQGINEGVDFGRQSAAGSTDRLLAVFFCAPALCWCARTMVASIIMYSLS